MRKLRDRALGGLVNAARDLISERWLGDEWTLERLHVESTDDGKDVSVELTGPPSIGPVVLVIRSCGVSTDDAGHRLSWSGIEVRDLAIDLPQVDAGVEWIRIGPGSVRPEDGIPRPLRWLLGARRD